MQSAKPGRLSGNRGRKDERTASGFPDGCEDDSMLATDPDIMISTTDVLPGFRVKKYVGVVWASSARGLDAMREINAMLKSMSGGELPAFRKLLNDGRHAVLHELATTARARGANAVIGMRLESTSIVGGTLEVYAYGTAVVVEKEAKK